MKLGLSRYSPDMPEGERIKIFYETALTAFEN
jgi:hypothetical protein